MSRDKKLIFGVLVLAALGGLVYRQVNIDKDIGAAHTTSVDLPEIKSSDDVDKISITNGEKGEVILEKQADKWMVTKPVKALANQTSVKSLLDNMKELKAKEVIASTADDGLKKDYSLDSAHAVHLVTYKGAEKKADDWFGKSGTRGEMMMVEGKPQVYGATGYSSYLYNKSASEWRDKEIFKFDDANATSVTVENKNGKFSFTKGDKWAGTNGGKPIDRFDEDKLKDLLRAFKALNADDFADEKKTTADTGLDKPDGVVSVTLKDNAGKYTLNVGKTSTGNARYAMKDGDATVFIVGQSPGDWANADEKRFQKPLPGDGGAKDNAASLPKPMPMPGMPGMPMGGMPPGHP
jgi:hypothetical protein